MYRQFIIAFSFLTLVTPLGAEPDQHDSVITAPESTIGRAVVDTPEQTLQQREQVTARDIFLVLDNSGSMKQNDPLFLTKQAVTEFIVGLSGDTRVAITIFDKTVYKAFPLTNISELSNEKLSDSLEQIDYKGLLTNSPMAIESAIYDLKNHGRTAAGKFIIFMTDGIVDTGAPDRDLEKAEWLTEELASAAADAGIKIFGIAFTDQADFELIQSLAQKTQGEYYRVLAANELQDMFGKLNTFMKQSPTRKSEPLVNDVKADAIPQTVFVPKPVIVEVPTHQAPAVEILDERRFTLIMASIILLIIALIVMVFLIRGNKKTIHIKEPIQEAYLNDIHGITRHPTFTLGSQPTILGRIAGKDNEHFNYFVVPEATIGRQHALIKYKNFSYWISDQGSINGTFVNGRPIASEARLKHGDVIRLHKTEFEFTIKDMVDSEKTVLQSGSVKEKFLDGEDVTSFPDHGQTTDPNNLDKGDGKDDPDKTQLM